MRNRLELIDIEQGMAPCLITYYIGITKIIILDRHLSRT